MTTPLPFVIDFEDAGHLEPGFVKARISGFQPLDAQGFADELVVEAFGHGRDRALAFALQAYAERLLALNPREF